MSYYVSSIKSNQDDQQKYISMFKPQVLSSKNLVNPRFYELNMQQQRQNKYQQSSQRSNRYYRYTGRTQTPNQKNTRFYQEIKSSQMPLQQNPPLIKKSLMTNMSTILGHCVMDQKTQKKIQMPQMKIPQTIFQYKGPECVEEGILLIAKRINLYPGCSSSQGQRKSKPRIINDRYPIVNIQQQFSRRVKPFEQQNQYRYDVNSYDRMNSDKEVLCKKQDINIKEIEDDINQNQPLVLYKNKYNDAIREDSLFYTFVVGPGNNSDLVRRVMNNRSGWKQTSSINSIFNFKWQQSSNGIKYERLTPTSGVHQVVNHFPNHKDISDKSNLIMNLKLYCETRKQFLFEITPVTFVVDLSLENAEMELTKFATFFVKNQPKMKRVHNVKKSVAEWRKRIKPLLNNVNQDKFIKTQNPYTKARMHLSFQEGDHYLWLLKPSDLNRGRGIQIFDTLETLEKLLYELKEGTSEYVNINGEEQLQLQNTQPVQEDELKSEKKVPVYKIKSQEFVIQKYIQKPLLVYGRKFDIRVWVLISHQLNCYLFKEGYLRTSCEPFAMDRLDNAFVHLTNNAVQKQSQSYGQFESGNQLSYGDFIKILQQQGYGDTFKEKIIPQMKEHIISTLLSVKKNFCGKEYKYCFEIFGYDFIIDSQLNTWLIEVNTNPCIEESSPLLQTLLPRMLNDAFKLTLDQIFYRSKKPKPSGQQNEKNDHYWQDTIPELESPKKNTNYSVPDYKDDENMWEFILAMLQQSEKKKQTKI